MQSNRLNCCALSNSFDWENQNKSICCKSAGHTSAQRMQRMQGRAGGAGGNNLSDAAMMQLLALTSGMSVEGSCDTLLIELLAIRLGESTTLAKSLVMAKPAVCGSGCEAAIPAPDASQRRVMAATDCLRAAGMFSQNSTAHSPSFSRM